MNEKNRYAVTSLEKHTLEMVYYVNADSPQEAERLCKSGDISYESSEICSFDNGTWLETLGVEQVPSPTRSYPTDDVFRTINRLYPWGATVEESSGPASQAATPPEDSRTKGEKSMSEEQDSETQPEGFSIVLDIKHPAHLKSQNIFLEFLQSWNVSDVVQEFERKGVSISAVFARAQDAEGERGGEVEQEHTKEGKVQTEKDVDMATEQWSCQFLRGWLLEYFGSEGGVSHLRPTADNWAIMNCVRMQGHHWRAAIFEIQNMLRIRGDVRGDGPQTVEAVRALLRGAPDLKAELADVREENARLRGVIEGMGKR